MEKIKENEIEMNNLNQRESFDKRENVRKSNETECLPEINEPKGLKGDYLNIILLLVLYFLQGIPIGIYNAIPLILVNKGVAYSELGLFSFALWPFSIKLLWAPIVDSIYSTRFGRRKSWFVPVQYSIGFFMILLSYFADDLINNNPRVVLLTISFFLLTLLTATQDIAVDGWAITMLAKHNVVYAASCNTVGQSLGIIFGNTVFLALESATFVNKWFRFTPSDVGFVTLSSYLLIWGLVFLIVTTFVMIFKHEPDYIKQVDGEEFNMKQTYCLLWKILCLPAVRYYALILLTLRIGTAAADGLANLKLVEYGLKKEYLSLFQLPLLPVQISLPFIVTKLARGRNIMAFFVTYPFRLLICVVMAVMVWYTDKAKAEDGTFSNIYYLILLFVLFLQNISVNCSLITIWSFNSSVSDPVVGGTYMTLLFTITNLGGSWPATLALYLVKHFNFYWCPNNGYFCKTSPLLKNISNATLAENSTQLINSTLITTMTTVASESSENINFQYIDGYYIETIIFFIFGLIWMRLFYKGIKWLENSSKDLWRCH